MTSIEMERSKIFWPWIFLLMLNMTDSFPNTPSVTKISSRREELNVIKSVLSVLDQLVKDLALKMEIIGGELHAINEKMPSYLVGENKEIINNITSITVENKRQNATILEQGEKQQTLERKLNDFVGECKDITDNITSITVETERQEATILQLEVMQQSLEKKMTDLVGENKEILDNITSITVESKRQNATILKQEEKQQALEKKLNDLDSQNKEIMGNITSVTVESKRQNATILQQEEKQQALEKKVNGIENRSVKISNTILNIESKQSLQQNTMQRFETRQSVLERKIDRDIAFTAVLVFRESISNLKENQKIVFGHTVTNLGNAYDETTGIFRCPKNGLYAFYYNINTLPDKFALVELTKNGNVYHAIAYSGAHSSDSTSGSTFVVLSLVKGDRIWLRASKDCSTGEVIKHQENTFSGFLLHVY